MKKTMASFTALSSALLATSALGVVRNDGTAGNAGDFKCSVRITGPGGSGTGTVIGGGKFLITAGHVVSNLDASMYTITTDTGMFAAAGTIVKHPTADLAIIPLGMMLDDSYDLYMGNDLDGMQVCFAGWGRSSATPGGGMDELPSGTKRAGYNILDIDMGDNANLTANEIGFDFDLAGGTGMGGLGNSEATTFAGDSGMGYLKQVGMAFQLVAVHGGILNTPGLNVDGSISYGTKILPYKDWITMNIPSPGTWSLVGCAVLVASRRRRA